MSTTTMPTTGCGQKEKPMQAKHTTFPLVVAANHPHGLSMVCSHTGSGWRAVADCAVSGEAAEANARRLAACWNACECLPTEVLEQHPAPFSELRTQRDELLTALQVVVRDWTAQFERAGHRAPSWCIQARAAIAQATGSDA